MENVQDSDTFCRLLVHGPEDVVVDLALFDRAAARDFVDVYALSRTFTKQALLEVAAEIDAGFDQSALADMLNQLSRYRDVDLELGGVDIPALRAFFQQWLAELQGNND